MVVESDVQPSNIPMGRCKTCKFPVMSRINPETNAKEKFCPRCDSVSPPSGLVVNAVVKPEDFKIVLNAKGFFEEVPADDPRPAATEPQLKGAKISVHAGKEEQVDVQYQVKQVEEKPTRLTFTVPAQVLDIFKSLDLGDLVVQLDEVQATVLLDALNAMETPKNMKDARSVIKLTDQLEAFINKES